MITVLAVKEISAKISAASSGMVEAAGITVAVAGTGMAVVAEIIVVAVVTTAILKNGIKNFLIIKPGLVPGFLLFKLAVINCINYFSRIII